MLINYFSEQFSLPTRTIGLLFGRFIANATTFMSLPLLAIHMTEALSFSSFVIGTVLTIELITIALLPIVTGPLSDRFGHRKFITIGLILEGLAFYGFSVFTTEYAYMLFAFVLGAGGAFYRSSVLALYAREEEKIKDKVFVLSNLAENLGVIVGPSVGVILASSAPQLFKASAALFLILSIVFVLFRDIWQGLDVCEEKEKKITDLKAIFRNKQWVLLGLALMPGGFSLHNFSSPTLSISIRYMKGSLRVI